MNALLSGGAGGAKGLAEEVGKDFDDVEVDDAFDEVAEDLPFGKGSIGNAGPFDLEVEELDVEVLVVDTLELDDPLGILDVPSY